MSIVEQRLRVAAFHSVLLDVLLFHSYFAPPLFLLLAVAKERAWHSGDNEAPAIVTFDT